MRLTLRTLLAYLDDQLEPAEIKRIGQKVAESDAAQELIARIKQVTRRRRLTTPPDGGPGERFDANIVAEYLDNELSSEQVAELEKLCLESDVHLAEISASHQILTLVLGEPALVPPTAKRRMYELVKGRKPKATRKPVAASTNGQPGVDPDADETLLLGLPLFRKAPWLRWALPLAAVLLLAGLGGILWKTLSGPGGTHVASNGTPNDSPKKPDKEKSQGEGQTTEKGIGKTREGNTPKGEPKTTKEKPENLAQVKRTGPELTTTNLPPPISKPNDDPTKEAGQFVSKGEALVHQTKDGEWERIPFDGPIFGGESVVSLPSYKSELRLTGGVRLLLWGALPEIPLRLPLLESAVTLHSAPTGLDADLTLHRGRIYLTNRKEKGPARVRVRFWREEVWDVTLEEPDTTAGIEFFSTYYNPNPNLNIKFRSGEEPLAVLVLHVPKGRARVKVNYDTFPLQAPPGPALIYWNNKDKNRTKQEGPVPIPKAIPDWDPDLKLTREHQELVAARDELVGQLAKKGKTVETGLQESLQSSKPEHRILAVRCLGAVGAVSVLLDGLGDPMHPDVRYEAANALRRWISRGKEQPGKLYDRKKPSGILIDKNFRNAEAATVLELLDGLTTQDLRQAETYETLLDYLKHTRIEVRELAYAHLIEAVGEDGRKVNYNPAGNSEQINQGAEEWKKLIMSKLTQKPKPPGKP